MQQFFIIIYKGLITFTVMLFLFSNSTAAQTNWTKDANNPVLNVGSPGTWDSWRVNHHDVYSDGDTLKMWYTGETAPPQRHFLIGLATSTDGGITWAKDTSNPVLTPDPGAWDSHEVGMPVVIFDDSIYKMWYGGFDVNWKVRIGYATSSDGITWAKDTSNPVLNLGPNWSWEEMAVVPNSVIFDGTIYKMWYAGFTDSWTIRIGLATSSDGINWDKDTSNPVLPLGELGEWDDEQVYTADVRFDGTMYQMWYMGYDGITYRIGYASSSDGIKWHKYNSNPVLNLGPSGLWDDRGVAHPRVIFDGTTYHMWYAGDDSQNLRIGYATAPVTSISDEDYVSPVDFLLVQNYPNPFNPITTIKYQIPEFSFVTLKVYDVLGSEFAILVNEEKPVGSYEVNFNAASLPSGIYFYKLQAGTLSTSSGQGFVETKKMVLMK
jgi:predicted GH43/DUF377 family glycosyl hydrolase